MDNNEQSPSLVNAELPEYAESSVGMTAENQSPVSLVEELKIEASLATNRRSKLFAKAAMEIERMTRRKDEAYEERNRVVAALAKCFPSGVARTAIRGWDPAWHGCVYVDLPTGQASWHFHDSQAGMFSALDPYTGAWDGHDTEEKYRRIDALKPRRPGETPTEVIRNVQAEELLRRAASALPGIGLVDEIAEFLNEAE